MSCQSTLPQGPDVRFIPNFVDMEQPEPAPVDENASFAFSGRLVAEKGAALAAEAAKLAEAAITFIGDGDQRDVVTAIHPQPKCSVGYPHAES